MAHRVLVSRSNVPSVVTASLLADLCQVMHARLSVWILLAKRLEEG